MEAANQRGCSRIMVHAPGSVASLSASCNQRRWWTITLRAALRPTHHPRTLGFMWTPGAFMRARGTTGFFTLGVRSDQYHLPHPRLGLPVILLLRRVLLKAFEKLRYLKVHWPQSERIASRNSFSTYSKTTFARRGEVIGFNSAFYDRVVRHAEVTNYNGEKLAKTPDLSFKLRHGESETRPCSLLTRRPFCRMQSGRCRPCCRERIATTA